MKNYLLIGDSTATLILCLDNYSVKKFYAGVLKFYESFVQKQLDFKSNVVCTLSFLDPALSQKISLSTFDAIEKHFPFIFDKNAKKNWNTVNL